MRRVMARPSPVPPYFRVIELSACSNEENRRGIASGAMPVPVPVRQHHDRARGGAVPGFRQAGCGRWRRAGWGEGQADAVLVREDGGRLRVLGGGVLVTTVASLPGA